MLEQNLNLTRNLTFNDDALTITTDGKIGIKNTSPGVELDVTGTARANTLTVLGDLSMEWTISMDAQDTLNFSYNNNLTMSLATDGALLLNGIGLDTIGSSQKVFTATGEISAGDVVRLNNDGTVSLASPTINTQPSKVLDNPNTYDTSAGDRFGYSVAITESYAIVGAPQEDDAGGTASGKAYIFDTATGNLLHTLDNPNAYGTSYSDIFGQSVAISESYAIVTAYNEDDAGGTDSGKAYIFDTSTGNLLHTLDNPNAYGTSAVDYFGQSVAISESYAIVGASYENTTGGFAGISSGKAYIFDTSTGNLLHTLDNPNAYDTSAYDRFGYSVAITESYAIVGAYREDDAGGTDSGKAYIYDLSTLTPGTVTSATFVLDNPNAGTNDWFGSSVSISESYAIVGAYRVDDSNTDSGKAYIYDNSTGNLLHTLDNPNTYDTSAGDNFGISVSISELYAIIGAYSEDDAGGTDSGKAYIYDTATGNLLHTLDNPNAYDTSSGDRFGYSVAISESYVIVGAYNEDDAGGTDSGKAYMFNFNFPWIGIAAENIANATTGIIDLPGAINRSQTGLTTNSIYYVDAFGSLTTTPTTFGMIGKAISTTDLQIFGNGVIELSKAIDVDFTTNTPTTTSGLVLTSDGDSTYSFQEPVVTTQIADLTDVDFTTNTPTTTSGLVLTSDGDSTYSFQPAAAESTYQENRTTATSNGQTVFAFSAPFEGYNSTTPANSHLEIYWNGSRLIYGPNNDYTITASNEITLTSGTGIVTGDIIFAVSISNMTLSRLYGP